MFALRQQSLKPLALGKIFHRDAFGYVFACGLQLIHLLFEILVLEQQFSLLHLIANHGLRFYRRTYRNCNPGI